MSAHVLLDLLKISCDALPSILSIVPDEFIKVNCTEARMQGSVTHMTLKSLLINSRFFTTTSRFEPPQGGHFK